MKQARIYMYNTFAGILTEDENGYKFEYDSDYLANEKAIENIYEKFRKVLPQWYDFIDVSFLTEPMKEEYKQLIQNRSAILNS